MAEPSKVIHVRNVGHEISEVYSFSLVECIFQVLIIMFVSGYFDKSLGLCVFIIEKF